MDVSKVPKKYIENLPSLDLYLADRLTDEHKTYYANILKERYTTDQDFSVDFDILWRDLGYSRKDSAKRFLREQFKENVEYKALHTSVEGTESCSEPVNKEKILMTIEAAQKFAMMSGTEKSKAIINFFITFVKIVQDYHCITLYHEKKDAVSKAAKIERHKTLLQSFANKNVLYQAHVGLIEGEDVDKFGHTGDLQTRMTKHLSEIGPETFLLEVIEHQNHQMLEKHVKNDPVIKPRIRSYEIKGKTQTELIAFDKNFTREKYKKRVLKIVEDMVSYSELQQTELELEKQRTQQIQVQSQMEIEKQKTQMEIEKQKTLQMQYQTQVETLKLQLELKKLEMQSNFQGNCNSINEEIVTNVPKTTEDIKQEDSEDRGEHEGGDKPDEEEVDNTVMVDGIRPLFRKDPRYLKPLTPEEEKYKRNVIRANSLHNGINAATSYVSQTICSSSKFRSKQTKLKQRRHGSTKLDITLDEIFEPMNEDGKRLLKDIWKTKNTTKGCTFTTEELFEAAIRYLFRNFPEFTDEGNIYAIE